MLINHAKVGDTAGRRGIVFFLALMERSWSHPPRPRRPSRPAGPKREGCADRAETA